MNGQGGDDSLDGGAGDDLVTGGAGNDTVSGGTGNDILRGNGGNDSLDGGDGNDSMGGAEGNDTLTGGSGTDTLSGGSGNDSLDGGDDDDTLNGDTGNDTITDLDGDNLVDAGIDGLPDRGFPVPGGVPDVVSPDPNPNDDRDSVVTGAGHDTILTGDDDDTINAGDGDNLIDGGFDDDQITAGSGDDTIISGEGSDSVSAGGGDDVIYGGLGLVLGSSANLIDDNFNPVFDDPIPGGSTVTSNGDDVIDAGAGDVTVFGEDDNDTILGGAGDDLLDGGVDDDLIEGGAGDDMIVGGQGSDTMKGGTGSDTFKVGTFTDPIFGDAYVEGADYTDPSKGDVIFGGEDDDDGDIDVLDLTGAGPLKIIYDDSIDTDNSGDPGEAGKVIFYADASATTVIGELTFEEIEKVIPCFTPGTRIATPSGEVAVETLREGDRVLTRDNGIQEIRWIGARAMQQAELAAAANLRPILVRAGSLGQGLPERDMVVSPQHRMLVGGEAAQLYFAESEVHVAAKHLVGRPGIEVMGHAPVTYVHFMFDRHEVVLSDGAWTESFQPGDLTLGSMGRAQRDEILALFPELETRVGLTDYAAARRTLKAHEAKLLQL